MSDSAYHRLNQDVQDQPFFGQTVDVEQRQSSSSAPDEEEFLLAPLAFSENEAQLQQAETPKEDVVMDKHWATAFQANVVVTVVAAVVFGVKAANILAEDAASGGGFKRRLQGGRYEEDSSDSFDDTSEGAGLAMFLVGGAVMIAIAGLTSVGMLHSLVNCGRGILFSSYGLWAGIWGMSAVVLALCGSPAAIFPGLVFAMIVYMLRKRKSRIEFGAANLKVAAMAIKSMPWTIRAALLMGAVQFLWILVVGVAAFGSFVALESVTAPDGTTYRAIYCMENVDFDSPENAIASSDGGCVCNGEKISDGECEFSGLGFPLMVVWLLSLMWGSSVIKNVVAATVTGSVASWWFTPNEDAAPVKGAFHRATHSAFGSLCKAAVVQNVMRLFHAIARRTLRFVPCAAFILSWAKAAVNYILTYTICFVSIYGLDFSQAMLRVRELFQKRGVTPLANDIIVEVGLALLAASTAIIYMFVGVALFFIAVDIDDIDVGELGSADTVTFWAFVGPQIFGGVACLLLINTVLEVVRSGFKAVFVCFVQDPEALATKHDPELHRNLSSAWQKMQLEHRSARVARSAQPIDPVQVN